MNMDAVQKQLLRRSLTFTISQRELITSAQTESLSAEIPLLISTFRPSPRATVLIYESRKVPRMKAYISPLVLSESGIKETVYNDFHVGEDCDVLIVAGCGIDNCGNQDSEHDGIHRFFVGKNSKIRYVEKHYGSGDGSGKRILNPVTEVYMDEGSSMEMEMAQIKGVDSTERTTIAELKKGAKLVVRERLMTHGEQHAVSVLQGNAQRGRFQCRRSITFCCKRQLLSEIRCLHNRKRCPARVIPNATLS